ncbi:hypothetical protein WI664_00730, partial [Vibrio cholerae]
INAAYHPRGMISARSSRLRQPEFDGRRAGACADAYSSGTAVRASARRCRFKSVEHDGRGLVNDVFTPSVPVSKYTIAYLSACRRAWPARLQM